MNSKSARRIIARERVGRAVTKVLAIVGAGAIGHNLAVLAGSAVVGGIAVGLVASVSVALVVHWLARGRAHAEAVFMDAIDEQADNLKIGDPEYPTREERHDAYMELHALWVRVAEIAPTDLYDTACRRLAGDYLREALPLAPKTVRPMVVIHPGTVGWQ